MTSMYLAVTHTPLKKNIIPFLIRVEPPLDDLINYITACSLVKQSIDPLRSPGKFPRPFIRPCKQIAVFSQVYSTTGKQVSPPSSARKISLSAHTMPYEKFFSHNLSIKSHRLALCKCELVTILGAFSTL